MRGGFAVAEDVRTEIARENKQIRYLRFMSDFALRYVAIEAASPQEAERVVENLKRTAAHLFPGREDTFELVLRPRFARLIRERWRLQ
jgi:hypothetical protein